MDDADLSVLRRGSRADIVRDPFPHLVVRSALDAGLFAQLEEELPDLAVLTAGRSVRAIQHDYPAHRVAREPRISSLWRRFFAYHTSAAFFRDVLDLFEDDIRALHRDLEASLGRPLQQLSVALRHRGGASNPENRRADAALECQFFFNYTRAVREVRGPHVDRNSELYAGLLYFRDARDDARGGGLEMCRQRPGAPIFPSADTIRVSGLPVEVRRAHVEVVRTIPYEANTLLFFLNSVRSLHAVSSRSATAWPRRHVNVCADLYGHPGLFRVEMPAHLRLKRRLSRHPIGSRLARFIPG